MAGTDHGGLAVSVLICSYRSDLDLLRAVVDAHLAQALAGDEVVVVLDGPQPSTRTLLDTVAAADDRVRVIELDRNVGQAMAKTAGILEVRGDVVVMSDDDIVPEPGLLDLHRRHHAGQDRSVLVGYIPVAPVPPGPGNAPSRLFSREYEGVTYRWDSDPSTILDGIYGGLVSAERALLREAIEARPTVRLDYFEDLDLGLRLKAVGARGAFSRASRGVHRHRKSMDAFVREARARGAVYVDLERRWGLVPEVVRAAPEPRWLRGCRGLLRRLASLPYLLDAAIAAGLAGGRVAGRASWWDGEDLAARGVRVLAEAQGESTARRRSLVTSVPVAVPVLVLAAAFVT
jgi:glycosyltransferase involved in cell wall biosynthesis